jgi:small-conductance mechanosensitive channel
MPLLPVFVAALLGAALDYASLWIARAAAKRERRAMEALFSSLRGSVVAYALALGFYVASDTALGAEGRNFETQAAGSLGIIGATIMASRLTTRFVEALGRRQGSYLPSASLFVSVANGSVIVVGMLSLLQFLQVPTTPILTVLATGGVVLALPLQSTVANLFGGIQIIAARQLQPGDYIKMDDGYEGFVSDITWRTTTIRDLSDNFIVVPNSKLASVVFTNYSQPEQRMTVAAPSLVSYRERRIRCYRICGRAAMRSRTCALNIFPRRASR